MENIVVSTRRNGQVRKSCDGSALRRLGPRPERRGCHTPTWERFAEVVSMSTCHVLIDTTSLFLRYFSPEIGFPRLTPWRTPA